MQLSYQQLENMLMGQLSVPESRRLTLRSRINYFQRAGFPDVPRVGRGSRIDYQVDAIFKLAIALELAQLNWPSLQITTFVQKFWPQLEVLVNVGFESFERVDQGPSECLAIIYPDGLSSVTDTENAASIEIVRTADFADWMHRKRMAAKQSFVILDVIEITSRCLHQIDIIA